MGYCSEPLLLLLLSVFVHLPCLTEYRPHTHQSVEDVVSGPFRLLFRDPSRVLYTDPEDSRHPSHCCTEREKLLSGPS